MDFKAFSSIKTAQELHLYNWYRFSNTRPAVACWYSYNGLLSWLQPVSFYTHRDAW